MASAPSADILIQARTASHRVVMLGGMAVIAYGLDRKTKDVDVWLEPMDSSQVWSTALVQAVSHIRVVRFWSLASRCDLAPSDIANDIDDFGVIRVSGMDRDVDIFRKPNELELEDFERVWSDARMLEDGVRLPSELDLYATKANTGREHDWQDQLFLESLVKKRFRERLAVCDLAEAEDLLSRFLDPEVLGYAQSNPHADVRNLVLGHLRQFEAEGDPFSRDILAAWKEPA